MAMASLGRWALTPSAALDPRERALSTRAVTSLNAADRVLQVRVIDAVS
jgi:hypothetical protein